MVSGYQYGSSLSFVVAVGSISHLTFVSAQTAIFIPKWESGRATAFMLGVGTGTTTYGVEIDGFSKPIFHTMAIGQGGYMDYHGGGMEDCRFVGAGSAVASCVRELYVTDSDGARGTLTDEITETLVPTFARDLLAIVTESSTFSSLEASGPVEISSSLVASGPVEIGSSATALGPVEISPSAVTSFAFASATSSSTPSSILSDSLPSSSEIRVTPSATPTTTPQRSHLPVIIGAILGCISFILLLALALLYFLRRRRLQKRVKPALSIRTFFAGTPSNLSRPSTIYSSYSFVAPLTAMPPALPPEPVKSAVRLGRRSRILSSLFRRDSDSHSPSPSSLNSNQESKLRTLSPASGSSYSNENSTRLEDIDELLNSVSDPRVMKELLRLKNEVADLRSKLTLAQRVGTVNINVEHAGELEGRRRSSPPPPVYSPIP